MILRRTTREKNWSIKYYEAIRRGRLLQSATSNAACCISYCLIGGKHGRVSSTRYFGPRRSFQGSMWEALARCRESGVCADAPFAGTLALNSAMGRGSFEWVWRHANVAGVFASVLQIVVYSTDGQGPTALWMRR